VGVAGGGQARTKVQELPDATLGGQVTHGTSQEAAVGSCAGDGLGAVPEDLLGGFAVGFVVVFAVQPHVVDPGGMRDVRVEARRAARRRVSRGGGQRGAQLRWFGGDHGVRVDPRVPAAGHKAGLPVPEDFSPDPELGELVPHAGQLGGGEVGHDGDSKAAGV